MLFRTAPGESHLNIYWLVFYCSHHRIDRQRSTVDSAIERIDLQIMYSIHILESSLPGVVALVALNRPHEECARKWSVRHFNRNEFSRNKSWEAVYSIRIVQQHEICMNKAATTHCVGLSFRCRFFFCCHHFIHISKSECCLSFLAYFKSQRPWMTWYDDSAKFSITQMCFIFSLPHYLKT